MMSSSLQIRAGWRSIWFPGFLVIGLLLLGVMRYAVVPSWAADPEALGQSAERAGKLREALTHYVTALQGTANGSGDEQRLREQCIAIALKLTPPPGVPDGVKRLMDRGRAAVRLAKSPEEMREAVAEFKKALALAPWLADGYYNLGVAEEKAGLFGDAMRSFKLYLLAAPGTADRDQVTSKVNELEYANEKAARDAARPPRGTESAGREPESRKTTPPDLSGRWWNSCGTNPNQPGNPYEIKMTGDRLEYRGWLPSTYTLVDARWQPWLGEGPFGFFFRYDPSTGGFVANLPAIRFDSGTQQPYLAGTAGRGTFTLLSRDHLIQEMNWGRTVERCEWRRQ